jgi:hypothetical protein
MLEGKPFICSFLCRNFRKEHLYILDRPFGTTQATVRNPGKDVNITWDFGIYFMFYVTEILTKFIWRKCKMLHALGILVSSKFWGVNN